MRDPSIQPGRRPAGANRRKYATGSSPGVVLAGGTGRRFMNPTSGPGPASGSAPFVIRYFSGSAGSGVRRRDGLAQLDPAGLVYYG